MKIKELHIRNIASIEKADINFEEDLIDKGTGIPSSTFLISGHTGTGKSVILDAISLALYKNTPRIAGVVDRQNNNFTDTHGNELGIDDIEQYTRIGISHTDDCYSEVVFEGNDGIEYRARLELGLTKSRTKDEHDNYILKHSTPTWKVKAGNADWQTGVTTCKQLILDAVGLTFEQFGRMAMLAQGQFAAFLTGAKKERESILEQLTNTSHFTEYGQAISNLYNRAKTEKKQAENTFNIEDNHTLGAEDLERHLRDLTELSDKEKSLSEQLEAIEHKIRQVEQLEKSNAAKNKALEKKAEFEAKAQSDEYKDKTLLVKDWESTVTERQRISDIHSANNLLRQFQAEEQGIKRSFHQLAADLKAREADITAQKAKIKEEKQWLDKQADREELYENHGAITLQIGDIQKNLRSLEKSTRELDAEKEKTDKLKHEVQTLKAKSEKIGESAKACQANIEHITKKCTTLKPEETKDRYMAIGREILGLKNLQESIKSHLTTLAQLADRKAEIEQETEALKQLTAEAEATYKTLEIARERFEEASNRLTTMGASLEDTLVDLRKRLANEHEERCPLCGQELKEIYAEDKFRAILTPIEAEKQKFAKERGEAETLYTEAKRKQDTASGTLNTKKSQLDQDKAKVKEEEATIKREMTKIGLAADNASDPTLLLSDISTRISQKEAEEQKLKEKLDQLSELERELNTLRDEKTSIDGQKAETDKQLISAENKLANNKNEIARLEQEAEKLRTELTVATSAITAKIGTYYPNWQTDMDAAKSSLTTDASLYKAKKKTWEEMTRNMENATSTRNTLVSHHDEIRTKCPEWDTTVNPQPYACSNITNEWTQLISKISRLKANIKNAHDNIEACTKVLEAYYEQSGKDEAHLITIGNRAKEVEPSRQYISKVDNELKLQAEAIRTAEEEILAVYKALGIDHMDSLPDKEELLKTKKEISDEKDATIAQKGAINKALEQNNRNIEKRNEAERALHEANKKLSKWELIYRYFGGTRFRTLVQTHILRPLLSNANIYLRQITDRYELTCSEDNEQLSILVHDLYNKGCVRSATILSGGERFMISLALSLALSSLNCPDMNVNILFIDEGFGTLDEKSLDSVMSTLEKLQEIAGQSNRRVGIISHREELYERIPTKILVDRRGESRSVIKIVNS